MNPRPHEKTTETFVTFAHALNVNVTPDDKDQWSAGITVAKAIDDIVDLDHNFNSGWYYEELLNGSTIPYMTDEEAEFVREVHSKLNAESKDRWRNATAQLGPLAIKHIEIANVSDYITAIRAEAPLMVNIVMAENDRSRPDYKQRNRYNGWLQPLMRYQYTADHLKDFKEDHEAGNTNVAVTEENSKQLEAAAAKDLAALILHTPPRAALRLARNARSNKGTFDL